MSDNTDYMHIISVDDRNFDEEFMIGWLCGCGDG